MTMRLAKTATGIQSNSDATQLDPTSALQSIRAAFMTPLSALPLSSAILSGITASLPPNAGTPPCLGALLLWRFLFQIAHVVPTKELSDPTQLLDVSQTFFTGIASNFQLLILELPQDLSTAFPQEITSWLQWAAAPFSETTSPTKVELCTKIVERGSLSDLEAMTESWAIACRRDLSN